MPDAIPCRKLEDFAGDGPLTQVSDKIPTEVHLFPSQ